MEMELPFSMIQERDLIKLDGRNAPYFVDEMGEDGVAYLCGVQNGRYKVYESEEGDGLKLRRRLEEKPERWTGPKPIDGFKIVDRHVNQSALYLHR